MVSTQQGNATSQGFIHENKAGRPSHFLCNSYEEETGFPSVSVEKWEIVNVFLLHHPEHEEFREELLSIFPGKLRLDMSARRWKSLAVAH